jgi:glycosyltransferase involved in cell wall biosynthesis
MTVPVTVLMSVYNGQRYLKESISSVLNQSFREFEFIIINDGSTDHSENIIKKFCILDNRIRFIQKKNTGLTQSLNKGIEIAKGEWIARIDADDICEKKRLETQYFYAQSKKSLVLIGSGFVKINHEGLQSKIYKYPCEHNQLKELLIKKKFFYPHSSFFIRSESIKKLNGYRERIKRSQDFDLGLRLSEIGEIACIEEPLVRIRKHKNQVSHEDNGLRQLVDSHVAFISYLLRQKKIKDPVSDKSSDDLFEEFYNFVKEDTVLNSFFKFKIFIQEFKYSFLNFNFIKVYILLFKSIHIIYHYYYFLILTKKSMEMTVLKKWIKKKSLCVE